LQIRADQQQSGELSLGPGGWLQGDGIHAGNFQEALLEQPQNPQASLRKFLRLIGVLRCDSFEPRHKFIDARIVLHGAGTQRVHSQVNRVIPGGKTREVAEHLDLADFRKTLDVFAQMGGAQHFRWFRFRYVQWRQFERALAGRRFLEDQALVLIRVP